MILWGHIYIYLYHIYLSFLALLTWCSSLYLWLRFSLRTKSPKPFALISAPPGAMWARAPAPAVPVATFRTDVTAAWCVPRVKETPAAAKTTCPAGMDWSASYSLRGSGEAPKGSVGVRWTMKCVGATGKRMEMCVRWEQPVGKLYSRGDPRSAKRTKDPVRL